MAANNFKMGTIVKYSTTDLHEKITPTPPLFFREMKNIDKYHGILSHSKHAGTNGVFFKITLRVYSEIKGAGKIFILFKKEKDKYFINDLEIKFDKYKK